MEFFFFGAGAGALTVAAIHYIEGTHQRWISDRVIIAVGITSILAGLAVVIFR